MDKNKSERIIKIINGNKYEIIPTETGYAYIISIALSIIIVCLFSHVNSLALIFHDLLIDIGSDANGLSMILAVVYVNISISGIVVNIALKHFSLRQVSLFAAILYSAGWFSIPFVQNIYHFIIAYGFLCGIGSGMLFTLSFTSFNSYISEKRMMILSLIQLITSSFTTVYPLIIEKLLQKYTHRGTLAIISAYMFHVIFAVICLHPVEWHSTVRLYYEPVQNETYIDEYEDEKIVDNDLTSIKRNRFYKQIVAVMDFLNISLLKDLVLLNLLMAVSLTLFLDNIYFILFPLHLFDLKFTVSEVAMCVTILGGSDLCGRAFLVIFSKFYKIRSEILFYSSLILITLFRIVFLFCTTLIQFEILTFILGFLRAFIGSLNTVVIADYIPEKFSAALGLLLLMQGFINFPAMSILGYLQSQTGGYVAGYIFVTTINAICLIPWTFKLVYFKGK